MTQAFNLSQLANKVNTSGQLDASTGLVNITPVANGGTGKSTVTTGRLLLGAGTSAMTELAGSAVNDTVKWNGSAWIAGAAQGSAAPAIFTFVAPGNWTLTSAVKGIKVTVVGGGGNGSPSPAAGAIGGGGGGGGTAIRYIFAPALPALPIPITAGAGTNSFGAFCSATGGSNGSFQVPQKSNGGLGGVGTGGDLNIGGSDGEAGFSTFTFGAPSFFAIGGSGGSSFLGGSSSGASVSSPTVTAGQNGNSYGGGGGGGANLNGAGGTGAGGIVIVEEFY